MPEKILFVEMLEKWQVEHVRERVDALGKTSFKEEEVQDLKNELGDVTVLSCFINSKVGKKQFDQMPNLKLVTTRSTGFDHIDREEARKRNIAVANVPVYGDNTVAEHTFALILSLSRNLRKAYFKTREGSFSLEGLMGFDLKGKTLGVIGTGHIGLHVIRMAKGFEMNVVAFDVRQNLEMTRILGFEYVPLDELLQQSHIISLHVPYMNATHHLINQSNMNKIRPGAILINTARGGLVETAALVKALDQGILAGAGLDVLEGEDMLLEEKRLLESSESKESWEKMQIVLKNHILLHRDNVIFTPHMAFYSKEAVMRILDTTLDNIRGFLSGKPENLVKT
jgi:D-lactate dehydrogenase